MVRPTVFDRFAVWLINAPGFSNVKAKEINEALTQLRSMIAEEKKSNGGYVRVRYDEGSGVAELITDLDVTLLDPEGLTSLARHLTETAGHIRRGHLVDSQSGEEYDEGTHRPLYRVGVVEGSLFRHNNRHSDDDLKGCV